VLPEHEAVEGRALGADRRDPVLVEPGSEVVGRHCAPRIIHARKLPVSTDACWRDPIAYTLPSRRSWPNTEFPEKIEASAGAAPWISYCEPVLAPSSTVVPSSRQSTRRRSGMSRRADAKAQKACACSVHGRALGSSSFDTPR